MAEFLVEQYVSRTDAAGVEQDAAQVRRAAEELSREGTPVRYVRAIFVPEDETCFFLCEAESIDAVRQTVGRAALRFERISTAAASPSIEEVHP